LMGSSVAAVKFVHVNTKLSKAHKNLRGTHKAKGSTCCRMFSGQVAWHMAQPRGHRCYKGHRDGIAKETELPEEQRMVFI
jgi:hypothetical protein